MNFILFAGRHLSAGKLVLLIIVRHLQYEDIHHVGHLFAEIEYHSVVVSPFDFKIDDSSESDDSD